MTGQKQSFLSDIKTLKAEARVALVVLIVLLLLSLFFYKERMLFIDAPHNLFLIINDGWFHIEEHRYGSFISQLLPLVASKIHLPAKWVIILYSASFNLFYLGVGLLLYFRFRNYKLLILFALYLTLFTSATFYWPNNEVHQGMGWLFLAMASSIWFAERKYNAILSLLFFTCSFFLAVWTHPLILLAAVFLWFYYWMNRVEWPLTRIQSVIYSIILVSLALWKFYFGMHHGYDSSKIETITRFHPKLILTVFRAPQLYIFLHQILFNYWYLPILFIVGIAGLLRKRKYLLASFSVGFALCYLLLVCITFYDGNSPVFYIESEYMPLAVICCLPFVDTVLPYLNGRTGVLFLLIIFSTRILYIAQASGPFTNRVVILENLNIAMKKKNLTKAIVSDQPPGIDTALIMNWGLQVESIMLSAIHNETPFRTAVFLNKEQLLSFNTASKDTLLGCWEKRPYSKLNTSYFLLDTTSAYIHIEYNKLME